MKRKSFSLLFTLAVFAGSVAEAGAQLSPELIDRLETAANHGLQGELGEIAAQLEGSVDQGIATTEERYTLAYAKYRLASTLMSDAGSVDQCKQLLTGAQELLEALIEQEPEDVESLSLLSGVLGLRIGTAPMLAMRLGPKSGAVLGKAARLAPDHPRVVLELGVSALNTPRMFGGSVAKAENHLRRAVALFASQPEEAPWPHWGRLDALAWLGQALAKQDKIEEARAAYQQALAIDRDMGWVRYVLLPQLEAQAKE